MIGALALGITAALFSLFLRKQQREIASILSIAVALFLFLYVLEEMRESFSRFQTAIDLSEIEEEVKVLLKALGVASVVQITSDICKEAGEGTVAGQIEMVGKAEILLFSIPILARLLAVIQGLLG